jgi:hypothetical protein
MLRNAPETSPAKPDSATLHRAVVGDGDVGQVGDGMEVICPSKTTAPPLPPLPGLPSVPVVLFPSNVSLTRVRPIAEVSYRAAVAAAVVLEGATDDDLWRARR